MKRFYLHVCIGAILLHHSFSSAWIKPATAALMSSSSILSQVLFQNFYPLANLKPNINIPTAISRFYPLPEEELLNSYSRGNSYLVQGMFSQALRELNRAIDVAPENVEVYMTRGIIFEKLNRWNDAIRDYKHANTLYKKKHFGKDDATAISNLANAESGLQDWEAALKDFTYASQLKSDFLAPQIGRALVSYQLGNKLEASKFFHDIAETYSSFPDGLAANAVLLFEEGKHDESKESWESAIELDDRYTDINWVADIRRWPPNLVNTLRSFLTFHKEN